MLAELTRAHRAWEAMVCISAVLVACSGSGGGKTTSAGSGGASAAGSSSDAASGPVSAAGGNASGGRAATGGNQSPSGASGRVGAAGTSSAGAAAGAGTASAGRSGSTGGNLATGGAQGAAGMGGAGGATSSSCLIPTLDASKPPKALTLSGSLGTHDPAVIAADGIYYLFATGNGIAAKTSTDMLSWMGAPDVFSKIPSWVAGQVSGVTNIWAPDVSFFGGMYHLYYAVSTFGSNKSCIGHATRASLGSGSWSDQGSVICSNVGTSDDWNAIDPNVIVDETGTPWLDFGSFWSGIKLVKLDGSGKRADTQILSIAKHSSIEGPYIIYQCGYYYLFVSFGSCCNGAYDYNVRVGRSKSVMGPYTDKAGTSMMDGGGTLIVQGNSTWTAPGHNAVLVTPDATYNVYHALNASHANPTLRVAQLVLDADGWPVSGGP